MLSVVACGCGRQPGRGKEGGRDWGRKGVLRSRKKKGKKKKKKGGEGAGRKKG